MIEFINSGGFKLLVFILYWYFVWGIFNVVWVPKVASFLKNQCLSIAYFFLATIPLIVAILKPEILAYSLVILGISFLILKFQKQNPFAVFIVDIAFQQVFCFLVFTYFQNLLAFVVFFFIGHLPIFIVKRISMRAKLLLYVLAFFGSIFLFMIYNFFGLISGIIFATTVHLLVYEFMSIHNWDRRNGLTL